MDAKDIIIKQQQQEIEALLQLVRIYEGLGQRRSTVLKVIRGGVNMRDDILKPKEAAEYLGWSLRTLYNNAHLIPHNKLGYRKGVLDKLLSQ